MKRIFASILALMMVFVCMGGSALAESTAATITRAEAEEIAQRFAFDYGNIGVTLEMPEFEYIERNDETIFMLEIARDTIFKCGGNTGKPTRRSFRIAKIEITEFQQQEDKYLLNFNLYWKFNSIGSDTTSSGMYPYSLTLKKADDKICIVAMDSDSLANDKASALRFCPKGVPLLESMPAAVDRIIKGRKGGEEYLKLLMEKNNGSEKEYLDEQFEDSSATSEIGTAKTITRAEAEETARRFAFDYNNIDITLTVPDFEYIERNDDTIFMLELGRYTIEKRAERRNLRIDKIDISTFERQGDAYTVCFDAYWRFDYGKANSTCKGMYDYTLGLEKIDGAIRIISIDSEAPLYANPKAAALKLCEKDAPLLKSMPAAIDKMIKKMKDGDEYLKELVAKNIRITIHHIR